MQILSCEPLVSLFQGGSGGGGGGAEGGAAAEAAAAIRRPRNRVYWPPKVAAAPLAPPALPSEVEVVAVVRRSVFVMPGTEPLWLEAIATLRHAVETLGTVGTSGSGNQQAGE